MTAINVLCPLPTEVGGIISNRCIGTQVVSAAEFPRYSNHNCKKSPFLRTPVFIFCLPFGRPCGSHAKCCMNERHSVLAKPFAAYTVPIYLQQFPSYSNRKCKKSSFSCTAVHIFVSSGYAPAIITQYVAMLAKPLAACTYLSSIVSELCVA